MNFVAETTRLHYDNIVILITWQRVVYFIGANSSSSAVVCNVEQSTSENMDIVEKTVNPVRPSSTDEKSPSSQQEAGLAKMPTLFSNDMEKLFERSKRSIGSATKYAERVSKYVEHMAGAVTAEENEGERRSLEQKATRVVRQKISQFARAVNDPNIADDDVMPEADFENAGKPITSATIDEEMSDKENLQRTADGSMDARLKTPNGDERPGACPLTDIDGEQNRSKEDVMQVLSPKTAKIVSDMQTTAEKVVTRGKINEDEDTLVANLTKMKSPSSTKRQHSPTGASPKGKRPLGQKEELVL